MREYFKSLPDKSTPLTGSRLNGLLNGEESIEKIVVGDISCKNLFNKYGKLNEKFDYTTGDTTLLSDGTIKATSNWAVGNGPGPVVILEPNKDYIVSFDVVSMETAGNCIFRAYGINEDGSVTSLFNKYFSLKGKHIQSFNTGKYSKIWFSFNGIFDSANTANYKYVIYDNVQVEKGTVATEYTPYKSLGYTSGSNENGSWVKYEDGRLEVEGIAECPASGGYADITFPVAFIDTNYIMVASHKYTGGSNHGGSNQLLNITSPQNYTTTQAYIYSYLPDGSFAGYPRNVQYIAKGRWK